VANRFLSGLIGFVIGALYELFDILVLHSGHADNTGSNAIQLLAHAGVGTGFGIVWQVAKEKHRKLLRSYQSSLNALANAVAAKDDETNGHCQRVVRYSILIGERIGLDAKMMQQLEWGALLHDIGKIAVPDSILKKPGPLTDDEWAVMKEHPKMGHLMVKDIDFLKEGNDVVLHHHERWDGRGYPAQLEGQEIPLLARIFAIADTFDAITSDRPYRKAQSIEYAREEIRKHIGTQFCPLCVDAFLRIPVEELERVQEESKILEYESLQLQKFKNIS
jgi:putative nucleotidyltransferase with HDIG domain